MTELMLTRCWNGASCKWHSVGSCRFRHGPDDHGSSAPMQADIAQQRCHENIIAKHTEANGRGASGEGHFQECHEAAPEHLDTTQRLQALEAKVGALEVGWVSREDLRLAMAPPAALLAAQREQQAQLLQKNAEVEEVTKRQQQQQLQLDKLVEEVGAWSQTITAHGKGLAEAAAGSQTTLIVQERLREISEAVSELQAAAMHSRKELEAGAGAGDAGTYEQELTPPCRGSTSSKPCSDTDRGQPARDAESCWQGSTSSRPCRDTDQGASARDAESCWQGSTSSRPCRDTDRGARDAESCWQGSTSSKSSDGDAASCGRESTSSRQRRGAEVHDDGSEAAPAAAASVALGSAGHAANQESCPDEAVEMQQLKALLEMAVMLSSGPQNEFTKDRLAVYEEEIARLQQSLQTAA